MNTILTAFDISSSRLRVEAPVHKQILTNQYPGKPGTITTSQSLTGSILRKYRYAPNQDMILPVTVPNTFYVLQPNIFQGTRNEFTAESC